MTNPLVPSTKLDAVNVMLSSIGQAPVNSLEVVGIRDVAIAKLSLDMTTREVLNKGWSFNTDEKYVLAPDENDNILVPPSALSIEMCAWYDRYVQRDNDGTMMLYDKSNHTFEITTKTEANIIWAVDFEKIPQAARTYIATRAARIFQSQVLGSDILFRFTAQHEAEALADLKRLEAREENLNILRAPTEINLTIFRRRMNSLN